MPGVSNGPRRGIRELKNLPAATKAFSAAANKQQKLQSSVSAADPPRADIGQLRPRLDG